MSSDASQRPEIPKAIRRDRAGAYTPQHVMPADYPSPTVPAVSANAEADETPAPPRKKRAEIRAERKQAKGMRKALFVAREYAVIIVVALLISTLIRNFLFQAFWIPSGSMKNTLDVHDSVAVSRLTPGVYDLQRGDVVVFYDAQKWLPPVPEQTGVLKYLQKPLEFVGLRPSSDEQFLVKRVIGLPGDTVTCCNDLDQLEINGKPVSEPYLAPGSVNSVLKFEVRVPEGKLWVMGDNRNNSADSRAHLDVNDGMVNIEDVVGKVVRVIWPYEHWKNPTDNSPFVDIPAGSTK